MADPIGPDDSSTRIFIGTVKQADTGTARPASTQEGCPAPAETYAFLEPPRAAGELGWLAHYRVHKLLDKGGMGLVFLGEDPRLERFVALKVMRPELANSDVSRQRFLREVRATAAVHSDQIVLIHEIGTVKDLPYFAAELLQGKPLDAFLREQPQLSLKEIVAMGLQIARGLDAAHRAGLIHRDIKPANLWVEEPSRRIKILDFGLARRVGNDDNLTESGSILGTPAYMAPEQAEGLAVDARCDLFSLGCVLYEVAAGKKPFDGPSTMAILKAVALKEPPPLAQISPTLPPALIDLITRMIAKDPAGRPESASAVIAALDAITLSETSATTTITQMPTVAIEKMPPRSRSRARFFVLTGAAVLLIALAAVALFSYFHKPPDILLGISAPFSGPNREVGLSMELGIKLCFRDVNDHGGIAGRKLKLIALDDGYEPNRALENMAKLRDAHHVFAVIGNIGTGTAEKTVPYALDNKLLLFGARCGAPVLRRDPPDRYVFNYRASYAEETEAIVKYLLMVRNVHPEQIAVFAQKDGYGEAGFEGVARTLRQNGRRPEQILRVGHERNSTNASEAIREVLRHPEIRAIVMVSKYKPAASLIRGLKDAKRDLIFANVSSVDGGALAEELRQYGPEYAPGVIVTQVVPLPSSRAAAVLKYRELLEKYYPNEQPGFVSLESYISATVLVEGLRKTKGELTTENLIDALQSMNDIDIGLGIRLHFGASEHQASHKVWGTVIDHDGHYQNLDLEPPEAVLDAMSVPQVSAPGPPIKVGILHSKTGTMAISESAVIDATVLAIDEINARGGILGRKIVPIIEDGKSDLTTFREKAKKLITQDKVSVVFGCWTSASRKTVKPVFEDNNHLLFYPVQYEGLEQSPNIVYTGAAPNQQIIPAVKWFCKFKKKKRLFLVGSDYVFPRSASEIIKDQATLLGAQIVGEEYVLLSSTDVAGIIKKIQQSKPDVILNTLNGDSNVAFFHALRAAGITPDKIPTVSFSITEEELKTFSIKDLAGDYAAWNYFMTIDSPANQEFVRLFQAKFGKERVTNDPMEAAYFGVHLWAQAVKAANTDEVNAVREAVKGQTFRAPEGPVKIDRGNNHTWKFVRIGRITENGRFEVVYSSEESIEPIPYPATRSRADWDQFLNDLHIHWGQWANPGPQ